VTLLVDWWAIGVDPIVGIDNCDGGVIVEGVDDIVIVNDDIGPIVIDCCNDHCQLLIVGSCYC